MDVMLLTQDRELAWRQFVENSPQATLAHLLGWRDVVARTYPHRSYYLMAMDGGTLVGILPLFLIHSPLFGRFLVTAPYLSYGGLLANDEEAAGALIQAARETAMQRRVKYVEIRDRRRVGQGLVLKEKYCTFLLSLREGSDALWKRFEGGKVRRAVKKSLKSGLSVESGHHLSGPFSEIMSHHMRDLGTPFHHLRFYQHIAEAFPHQSEILMAKYDNRYVGGILLVSCKDTVYWLYGAALREYRRMAPTSLLLWEALCSACERGFAYFDFGRSRWESGTFVFKRKWGAQPVPLSYEYDLLDSAGLPDMDPTNPRFRLAIALWKRLPVFAVKALGPLIIRDIP